MNNELNLPTPKPGILDISRYVPGKSGAPAGVKLHKLSANESPLGPSPQALEALGKASMQLAEYPEPASTSLREAIGQIYGLNAGNIICSNGSDEVLGMLANAYLAPGDEAIYTQYGFLVYRIAILTAGATPVIAPEYDCRVDVDAILACVTDATKIIFLANPNNPTGTYLPIDEVRRLHEGLPATAILVIDAAYAEYVRRNDYEAGIELVSANKNVVMTRTFSKIYGLAGLRVGWTYAPTNIVEVIDRIRGPFNVNSAAIAAAKAAIRHQAHVDQAIAHNVQWLEWVTISLEQLGLKVTPSVCNFVLVHFPKTPGKTASDADRFLTERGYVLRNVGGYGLPDALRMTIGSEEANRGVITALEEFLGKGRADV